MDQPYLVRECIQHCKQQQSTDPLIPGTLPVCGDRCSAAAHSLRPRLWGQDCTWAWALGRWPGLQPAGRGPGRLWAIPSTTDPAFCHVHVPGTLLLLRVWIVVPGLHLGMGLGGGGQGCSQLGGVEVGQGGG